jgi:hypothetical protein
VFPCHERRSSVPHVQVIGNQTFEIEWTNGFGGLSNQMANFVIMPEVALAYMGLHNYSAIIAAYIAQAPASANVAGYGDNMSGGLANGMTKNGALKPGQLGDKTLLANPADIGTTAAQQAVNNAYFTNANLSSSDHAWVYREPVYMNKGVSFDFESPPARPIQQQPLAKHTVNDVRVSYHNPNYPWIEAIHSFTIPYLASDSINWKSRSSIARFAVPARNGPGDYVAWSEKRRNEGKRRAGQLRQSLY